MPERGERDAELAGRQVAREVVELAQHELGAPDPLLGLLLQPRAAGAHEGELGGDEEAVEQHENEDREEEERGHAAGRGPGAAAQSSCAPLLREGSSSGIGATGGKVAVNRLSEAMRIVSLVPSATETLFALGVGEQVAAVTHECDYPVEALDLPRVTHDVIGPGLEADEIDAAVRALTGQGKAIYELDGPALRELAPDLIVTQALCAVCAVSVDDVRALAEQMPSPPEVVSLDATTLGEVLADIRTLGRHVGAPEAAEALIADAAERIDRVQAAVADAPLVTVAALEWLASRLRGRALDPAARGVRGRDRRARAGRGALRAGELGWTSRPRSRRSSW
jgi:hypothetical protein